MNSIFVITELYFLSSGEKNCETSVFSNFENAENHFYLLKSSYIDDFESDDLKVNEIRKNNSIVFYGVDEENGQYFKIKLEEKIIDFWND